MRAFRLAVLGALLLMACSAGAQKTGSSKAGGPGGSSSSSGTTAFGPLGAPAVASSADVRTSSAFGGALLPSGFVVAWTSMTDGDDYGIVLRRFDTTGTPLGDAVRVNTTTTLRQIRPSVAASSTEFLVVWASEATGTSRIAAQRFTVAGVPAGTEFRVNTGTAEGQKFPAAAAGPDGSFVVAWASKAEDDPTGYGIYAQRYAAGGAPAGAEFRVNTYTTSTQTFPAVTADPATGNLVVVWSGFGEATGYGLYGQRFASTGAPLGVQFRVSADTLSYTSTPSVSSDSTGKFVVAWSSYSDRDGSGGGVFAQRFTAAGVPTGSEFRVNTYTTDLESYPAVVHGSDGGFTVAWRSSTQDAGSYGVYVQRFAAAGATLGGEFRANTYTTGTQNLPVVLATSSAGFHVAWLGTWWGRSDVVVQRFGVGTSVTGHVAASTLQADPLAGAGSAQVCTDAAGRAYRCSVSVTGGSGAPVGACQNGSFYGDTQAGAAYVCVGGAWKQAVTAP